MKKTVGILLAVSLVLMAGCGKSSEKVIDREILTNPAGSGEQAGKDASATAESSAGGKTEEAKGYVFYYKDVMISVDADMAPLLEKLGEPASYYEAPSCAFDGLDKVYTYNSFEVETYPKKEQDLVSMIVLKDDAVMTAEKIFIGSSLEDVKKAYGEASQEGGALVYEKDGMKLTIMLENGAVTSIQYASKALEE